MVTCHLSVVGLVRQHLYPELTAVVVEPVRDDILQPFTEEQLRSLYYNYELEHVDEFVQQFLQVICFSVFI